ncbi:MAG: hypothetical protein H6841_06630 [Planctomycetes bacterium]|nr:hypothetical protein [Planctomycetota bacterium]
MTKAQALEHLDWFVSLIPERLALLRRLYQRETDRQDLDYTFESLVPFWIWMRKHVKSGKKRFIELKHPRDAVGPPVLIDDPGFSLTTLALIEDAGRYVAEIFMRRYPFIRWTLSRDKDKKMINYNLPVLEGIKSRFAPNGDLEPIDFNPERQVLTCASKYLDGDKSDELLLNVYKRWRDKADDSCL